MAVTLLLLFSSICADGRVGCAACSRACHCYHGNSLTWPTCDSLGGKGHCPCSSQWYVGKLYCCSWYKPIMSIILRHQTQCYVTGAIFCHDNKLWSDKHSFVTQLFFVSGSWLVGAASYWWRLSPISPRSPKCRHGERMLSTNWQPAIVSSPCLVGNPLILVCTCSQ